jgi:hypothetical protein
MRPLVLLFAILTQLPAASPLFQSSFENAASGWTAVRGVATADPSVTYQNHGSMRLRPGSTPDACVRSAPIALSIGEHYELSGWIRTEQLDVRDLDRTPIAIGAALSVASMPFDVHSESVGGTRDWTRVHLRFVATRAQDSILLTAGTGGAFQGTAWFAGVSIDKASSAGDWPVRAAVTSYGPAYRYPYGGWIYLHIEGQPYQRGYQHGRLMAKEIVEYMRRCEADLDSQGKKMSWDFARATATNLFLHGFDQEILDEMKGIAEGAADAGATWSGRRIDLTDIVVVNTTVELGSLEDALDITPSGLDGLNLDSPLNFDRKRDASVTDHCSAFAATGKATRDGRMVIGHVTWWPLTLAEQTNVMLDLKPASGHRMLIQSYPGGIESGTDWYQNDAGIVLTETTIRQTPFNRDGTPVAFRARKAIQYSDNIDQVVEHLTTKNNGLYSNEWLMGDAKTNEIAMLELGTYKSRLYRSSKNDWFGGTGGFYWSNNNVKDLSVRLEYEPDPGGPPANVPYVPGPRDLKWQQLYREHSGKIDEQFAFLAFRTAPLVSSITMDAKVVTADMASRMMVWADFGKPNQREWAPSRWEKEAYSGNEGLYASGYRMIAARTTGSIPHAAGVVKPAASHAEPGDSFSTDQLWKGWLLPASDADLWFTAGSAAYFDDLRSKDLTRALAVHWAEYRSASAAPTDPIQHAAEQTHKGVLFLDQLRHQLGDRRFLSLMTDFYAAHTTQTVTAQSFLDAAGVRFSLPRDKGGPRYLVSDVSRHLGTATLVYGTVTEAGANRYAAEQLQKQYLDTFESAVPIRKDFEVTAEELRAHDVIFVGRPETNSALMAWREQIGLDSDGGSFRIQGVEHASETEGLALAATNPLDRAHMVLVLAGNSALATVRLAEPGLLQAEYAVYDAGQPTRYGFLNEPR